MATHCSILAWRIARTAEPGGLQSTGSPRVRHEGATSAPLPFEDAGRGCTSESPSVSWSLRTQRPLPGGESASPKAAEAEAVDLRLLRSRGPATQPAGPDVLRWPPTRGFAHARCDDGSLDSCLPSASLCSGATAEQGQAKAGGPREASSSCRGETLPRPGPPRASQPRPRRRAPRCARLSAAPRAVAHPAPLCLGFPGKKTGVGCRFLLRGSSRPRDPTHFLRLPRVDPCFWAPGMPADGLMLADLGLGAPEVWDNKGVLF